MTHTQELTLPYPIACKRGTKPDKRHTPLPFSCLIHLSHSLGSQRVELLLRLVICAGPNLTRLLQRLYRLLVLPAHLLRSTRVISRTFEVTELQKRRACSGVPTMRGKACPREH